MHTGREEFVTLEVLHQGRVFDYAVFFTVTKVKKAEGAHLNLFVNSAHERHDPLKYKKPIAFKFILLIDTWAKKSRCRNKRKPPTLLLGALLIRNLLVIPRYGADLSRRRTDAHTGQRYLWAIIQRIVE